MLLSFILFLLVSYNNVDANKEKELYKNIFSNYNSNIRPVKNFNDSTKMKIGIEIEGLEYFNQVSETIGLNIWVTMSWKDEYLTWDKDFYGINYLNIESSKLWLPDLELYNAAKLPSVYNINDQLTVYNDGTIIYKRPATFSFLCPLELSRFPYDKQTCSMEFGSWKFNNAILDIIPFSNKDYRKAIIIDSKFSHNEWNIKETSYKHEYNEYLCCPGELWPVTTFDITMQRNSQKYDIILIMNTILVFTAYIISLIKFKNYRRTYILVFIPLTIIWLIQSISYKIPVIGYFTTMQKILFMSFIVCELFAGMSGILYSLYSEFYNILEKLFRTKDNYKTDKYKNYRYIKIAGYDSELLNIKKSNKKIFIYKTIKYYDKIIKSLILIIYIVLLIFFLNN